MNLEKGNIVKYILYRNKWRWCEEVYKIQGC